MNHLAHFALAGEEEALVIGALLGDYVKGPLAGRLPAGIEAGVRLHRRIDGFTDSHPVPAALRSLFGPGERRLSGVLLDLYFDHLLVLHDDLDRFGDLPVVVVIQGRPVHEALVSRDQGLENTPLVLGDLNVI